MNPVAPVRATFIANQPPVEPLTCSFKRKVTHNDLNRQVTFHQSSGSAPRKSVPNVMLHLNRRVTAILAVMSEGARRDAEELPVKWLTDGEVESWLSLVRLMTWLPWSIDQQLRRDSNLGMVEYQVLARLSQSPGRTMRMSSLADLANASLSRLSHLFKRLEGRGLVLREPDPADGRFTNAILTEKGFQTLAEAAPAHVAHMRSLVIDVLSPEQLRRLGRDADRIMTHIDTSGIN
jgi:DNA-binding MarR family transcriptional regulator